MIIVTRTSGTNPEPPIEFPNPARERFHFGYVLIDADGTAWDLVDGPVVIQSGPRGFGLPDPTHWADESANLDGAIYAGMRTGPREVVLPVRVSAKEAAIIASVDSAFADAIAPEHQCTLIVIAPDSTTRSIGIRYDTGGDVEYPMDLLLAKNITYPLEFTANDPWWHTDEKVVRIENHPPQPLFPGPPFNIGSAYTFGNAEVTNPGDKPAWGRWIAYGPFTSFTVGVGASVVTVAATKTAGHWIEVDMDPAHRTIVDDDGTDMRNFVTDVAFEAIPPGESALTVEVGGADVGSAIELHYVPNFRRAW